MQVMLAFGQLQNVGFMFCKPALSVCVNTQKMSSLNSENEPFIKKAFFFLKQTWLAGTFLIIQNLFKYLWWIFYRAKPIGSTSDAESFDFDRMKQVSSDYHSKCMVMVQKMRTDWSANYYKICCVQKEILEEVVRELQKVKEEIIDGRGGGAVH